MSKLRILISIVLMLSFVSFVSSASYVCSQEPDEYVIKCTIPEKYFIQQFTCLNNDCTIKLENNVNYQKILFPGGEESIILKNQIQLKDVYKNLNVLQSLCEEPIPYETLKYLSEISEDHFSTKWKFFSGQRIVIEPYTPAKESILKAKMDANTEELANCYETKTENVGGWIVESKIKRPYCDLVYDNNNECFTTEIDTGKMFAFILYNQNDGTRPYLFVIFGLLIAFAILLWFTYYLHHRGELKRFYKPTTKKIVVNSLVLLPSIYIFGLTVGWLVKNNYYFFIDTTTEVILIAVIMYLIYFSVCLYYYIKRRFFR